MPRPHLICPVLLLASSLVACGDDGGATQGRPADPESPTLADCERALYSCAPFPIGVAVNPELLMDDAQYREAVLRHFDAISPENSLKFSFLHPGRTKYTFEEADWVVDFADDHDLKLTAHVLLWHSKTGTPEWVKEFEGSDEEFEAAIEDHIKTVVGRFAGRIDIWDVVNEAIVGELDPGSYAMEGDVPGELRPSTWRKRLGDDFIAKAFHWARKADPDAKLFYNDFGLPFMPEKREGRARVVG